MLGEGAAAGLVGLVDDVPHLAVDLGSGGLAVALALTKIAAKEGLLLRGAVDHRAEALGEAVLGDHLAGDVRGLLQVIGRAGRDVVEDELLGHTAAQTGHNILEHLALGDVAAVLFGQIHGVAACLTAGDDGDLMHAGVVLAVEARHRVARLMVGSELFLLGGDDPALFLRAGHDLHGCLLDVLHRDGLAAAACSQQSGLVDKVLEVSACKARGALCDDPQRDIRGEGLVLGVDLEYFLTAFDVGQADVDLTVEAARTEQGLVQNVGAVGGGHNDDAVVGLEAIHLHQQLVQRLLTFIVTAAEAGTALTAHCVDLINEDDAGHRLFCLVEEVAHAGCAHADVHLDEVRAGDGVEGHAGLTGTGAGQQGLAGARRADEQYAMGDACTQRVELVGTLEELHDLFQLFLLFVLTGHIGKGGRLLVLVLVLYLGLADIHDAAATADAAPHHGEEQEASAAQHPQIEDDLHPWDGLLEGGVVVGHGRVGVRRVVGLDIFLHVLDENVGVGQLIADGDRAVVLLYRAGGLRRGGEHPAQQTAGGLRGALGGGDVRQGQVALLQVQGDDAGVAVQREGRDLIVLKIMDDGGVAHGRATGAARAAAHHRPDHQHSGQRQCKDERIDTRSFRLQKESTPVLVLFLTFRRRGA